jgi:hypothetical protein
MARNSTWLALVVGAAAVVALAPLIASSCGRGGGGSPRAASGEVDLAVAFEGQSFFHAVDLLQHPVDDERWYVVEQTGIVETFLESDPAGTRRVAVAVPGLLTSGENGLLGMAFHPDFALNGEAILSYVLDTGGSAGTSEVARYVSADGGLTFVRGAGDPVILQLVQPYSNHNGGDVDFGDDGMLYVAFGDGGGTGDPDERAQDNDDWFGAILRLDVDGAPPYAVPPDNPLVGKPGLDEIWAFGFRNPWRMSFDRTTGDLWVGDVGQSTVEEIDLVVRGGNYGWDLQEGDLCYPALMECSLPGLVPPVAVHRSPEAKAITGGVVDRVGLVPALKDHYVYGDFVAGRLFAFDVTAPDPAPRTIFEGPIQPSSFAQSRAGELFVVLYAGGAGAAIRRIVARP